jgi:hypothetical protein
MTDRKSPLTDRTAQSRFARSKRAEGWVAIPCRPPLTRSDPEGVSLLLPPCVSRWVRERSFRLEAPEWGRQILKKVLSPRWGFGCQRGTRFHGLTPRGYRTAAPRGAEALGGGWRGRCALRKPPRPVSLWDGRRSGSLTLRGFREAERPGHAAVLGQHGRS